MKQTKLFAYEKKIRQAADLVGSDRIDSGGGGLLLPWNKNFLSYGGVLDFAVLFMAAHKNERCLVEKVDFGFYRGLSLGFKCNCLLRIKLVC